MNTKELLQIIEDLREKARKEGYKQGIEDGNISDGTLSEKLKEAYTNGANDAWECAKDLTSSSINKKYDQYKRFEIFGNTDVDNIFTLLTGAKALEKLKKYEEAQKKNDDEIKFGDILENYVNKYKYMALKINEDGYVICVDQYGRVSTQHKGGFKIIEHNPQVENVFESIRVVEE